MNVVEHAIRAIGWVGAAALASCASASAPEEQPVRPAQPATKAPSASAPPASAAPAASAASAASAAASAVATTSGSASSSAAPPEAPPPVPGKLCVVLHDESPRHPEGDKLGYVDDAGKLAWIVRDEGRSRMRVVWDGDKILRLEGYDANGPTGGGIGFSYGSKGELLRMTYLPSRVWWEGTYEGTFGKKKKRDPTWIYAVLRNRPSWPPYLPFQEGLTQPAFTGKLVIQYGQPQSYEIRCKLTGEGRGRCDDDYERVDTLQGFRPLKWEHPKEDVTKERWREHQYEGDRLVKTEHKDTAGKVVYRSTYEYDKRGRLVRVHHTDFGATDIKERLEHKCDVAG